MSLWSRIRSCISRRAPPGPQIRVVDDGFDLLDSAEGSVKASVRWAEVARIQVYKLDLVTVDCICLLFEFAPGRAPVQISEEWAGFQDLFGPLAQRFPTIPESWYVDVMTPVFDRKQTVLFQDPKLMAPLSPITPGRTHDR